MEPIAAASATSNGAAEKTRRQSSTGADYLQIDPSSTFINNTARNGGFEELPENFLDTISPHPTTPSGSGGGSGSSDSPPLAQPTLTQLAPMSTTTTITTSGTEGAPSSNVYSGMLSSQQYSHLDSAKSTFSNSTAGLLSPLHLDRRIVPQTSRDYSGRDSSNSQIPPGYIKEEEVDLDGNLLMTSLSQQQQEMERISQAETPPAVSNVELASTMIASLIGGESHGIQNDSASPSPHNNYSGETTLLSHSQMIKDESEDDPTLATYTTTKAVVYKRSIPAAAQSHNNESHDLDFHAKHVYNREASSSNHQPIVVRKIYSTQDSNDPLNAEIDDDIYIDTKDLCKRIAFELKQHSIPQAIFAERILCRSQGTLSDLLRNPKPWNKLKSGRETFRRMYNWVRQPLATRLAILDMKTDGDDAICRVSGMSPPTPAQNVRQQRKSSSDPDGPSSKRPRLVFTDIQKRTLQAIFKETQRPSREMQQTIAEHLRLDLSTVANFFMNARRRSRIGPNNEDGTAYQQMDVYKDEDGISVENDGVYEHELDEPVQHLPPQAPPPPQQQQSSQPSQPQTQPQSTSPSTIVKEETPDEEEEYKPET
ncbi:unnamed protein product [Caenorhabditis angaria]|uniref:One cut domain family member n=1 Tax=Caenorhabditis angaria TaxID=860376 RepID=A0A9P1MXB6_9PELO|nr:unnamed protein product [Caenorhabditis angaria]